jgi:PPOX class probable F420-dependent enzyme
MQPQTADTPDWRSKGARLDVQFPGKYLSLTSFKRDGTGVATPVWFVTDNDRLIISTDPQSFKAKRIRRNPSVMIAPCTASGRPRGDPIPAQVEVLPASEGAHAKALMARKYRLDRVLILPIYRAIRRLRGDASGTDEIMLSITPS